MKEKKIPDFEKKKRKQNSPVKKTLYKKQCARVRVLARIRACVHFLQETVQ